MKALFDVVGHATGPVSGLLCAACLLSSSVTVLHAQDAEFIGLIKAQNFRQVRPHLVSLREWDDADPEWSPFVGEVFVDGSGPGVLEGATVDLPSPPGGGLTLEDTDDPPEQRYLGLVGAFDTFGELNTAFPDGTFTFHVTGANDSPPVRVVALDLAPDGSGSYRGVPKFTAPVVQGVQAIDPDLPFEFQWDAIPGGLESDFVTLSITDESGNDFFYSPDLSEPDALDGTSTSFTLQAGTLHPGMRYEVSLGVYHLIDFDMSYTAAVSAYGKTTFMEIRTIGGEDFEPPSFLRSVPFPSRTNVATNTIVTFVFNEAMDPSVNPADAITWTGVPDPNLFAYRWSPDHTLLFCHYVPGLPASTTIVWALNPAGAAAQLRDPAGNAMSGSRTGTFVTSPTSVSGIPDVASLTLFRAKLFHQTGGGIVDVEQFVAGFDLELTGPGTVSSVDLDIPGVGLETGLGEFARDFRSINGEASFAEPDDLLRIVPPGSYTLTLHTFHDGIRTVKLNLGSGAHPAAPTVQDHATTQAIDGSRDFVLQWLPWTEGTASDSILVSVEGDSGILFFESPDIGEPMALDGTATSVTIPANSLPPGRSLEAQIIFVKIVSGDSTQYPGVPVGSAFASATALEFQTTGSPFAPQLELLGRSAGQVRLRLTGERGRFFQIQSGPALPVGNPVWSGRLLGNASGYRASFDYTDYGVTGVPTRFYQAWELGDP